MKDASIDQSSNLENSRNEAVQIETVTFSPSEYQFL